MRQANLYSVNTWFTFRDFSALFSNKFRFWRIFADAAHTKKPTRMGRLLCLSERKNYFFADLRRMVSTMIGVPIIIEA